MTRNRDLTNYPHVKVTAKFAVFQEYCLRGDFLITHSVPLVYNDKGALDKHSRNGIRSIISNKYGASFYSKNDADTFIEYIRVQSLAQIGWPFNKSTMFTKNDGVDHMSASPFNEATVP